MLNKIAFIIFNILLLAACSIEKDVNSEESISIKPIIFEESLDPRADSIPTLHAIIIADTNNETVGESVEIDMRNINRLLESIAGNTGLILEPQSIYGNQLNLDNVTQAINKLRVGTNDVVFFYYSGHGANTEKGSQWPSMLINNKLINLDKIITTLSMKKPRFLMVLSDSCNNFISNISSSKSPTRNRPKLENYRKLFLNYRGYIIASSSIPGQRSWGNNHTGGLFTHAFISSLNKNSDWHHIMDEATKPHTIYTQGRRNTQQPQHTIEIEKIKQRKYLSIQILPKQQFRVGESMQIKIDNPSNEEQYLFIWDINSHGKITRIIPNQYTKEKTLPIGTTIISKKTMGFELKIVEPIGNNALVATLVKKQSIQDILYEQIENLAATNTQTALRQLHQILEKHNSLIKTIEYEIR
ncbi:caspase family protein [Candidatus Marithrix sp. Canyon 246]|uniref:caspase family protein n=1 Tax=Candidatus Marithrix sp. Canyon 246 TaxID=1827136 RepID=UPI00084A2D49|nr:caspase family protein [Candidatus Marithrix sp. Canyon 246]